MVEFVGKFLALPMSTLASASVAAEEQQPSKKKRPSKEPISFSSLPDDLVVSCLARVSKLYYPTLSLVSKNFRSLLASPELYQTRTLFGCTESCLYVCLQFPNETNPRWFTLCQKPNRTLTNQKNKSSGNLLAPIPVLNSAPVDWSSLISVGSKLYAISRAIEDSSCGSNVSFLDCRTHTWLEGPRMRLAHTSNVYDGKLDGKIYVPGNSEDLDSLNCVEVFNTKTQTWKPVPPEKRDFKGRNMEGKIYISFGAVSPWDNVALKPKNRTLEFVGLNSKLKGFSICMIGNIIYSYIHRGIIRWRTCKGEVWRNLKGLKGLPKFASYSTIKLANCGGKIVVFGDKYVRASGYKEKMIWCAKISLRKRKKEEIWGKVECIDAVLTVPKSYKFVCAIASTL